MWLTDLADVIRRGGLNVVEVSGWRTRGYLDQQMAGVRSAICHWTATPPHIGGDYPTLNTILNGNSSTPGPLAQLGLGRSGTVYVCAAGLCNHAGVVDTNDHSNPWAVGIEAEYHPDQGAWPDVQQRAYERLCAVLSAHYRFPVSQVQGHYEVARPLGRKTDPNTLPGGMAGFRTRVAAVVAGEDDDMFTEADRGALRDLFQMLVTGEKRDGRLNVDLGYMVETISTEVRNNGVHAEFERANRGPISTAGVIANADDVTDATREFVRTELDKTRREILAAIEGLRTSEGS